MSLIPMIGETFTCSCCYGEFIDEMTDAEKHEEHLIKFGKELEASTEFDMICDECYCELMGETLPKHTYAQVMH